MNGISGRSVHQHAKNTRPLVLLAEDDSAFRRELASALRRDGYDVLEAGDAGELVDHVVESLTHSASRTRPDLVITDACMPGMSGLDAMAALRNARYASPFVVMSASGRADTHEAAMAIGASAVFDKPFNIDDLRREVARQLLTD